MTTPHISFRCQFGRVPEGSHPLPLSFTHTTVWPNIRRGSCETQEGQNRRCESTKGRSFRCRCRRWCCSCIKQSCWFNFCHQCIYFVSHFSCVFDLLGAQQAVVISAPGKTGAKMLLEDFNVRTLYDKLQDQTILLMSRVLCVCVCVCVSVTQSVPFFSWMGTGVYS